jgi:hypothetical protein
MRLPKLTDALEKLPAGSAIHIHFHDLDYIDYACLEVLTNWEHQRVKKGGTVSMDWDGLMKRFHQTNRLQPSATQAAVL